MNVTRLTGIFRRRAGVDFALANLAIEDLVCADAGRICERATTGCDGRGNAGLLQM